jgi:nicotinamide-nucleotide amidase
MQTIIISIGDELIGGASVDTNSAYLSTRLSERGIAAVRHVTVGDDADRITKAIASAAEEAELVIITGGLGPTLDDLTRQALADAMGVELIEDARSAEQIRAFFDRMGRAMKPSNLTQAMIPAGTEAIDNNCGTAPGIAARLGRAEVFALPGPPNEMTEMFERQVVPRLGVTGALARRILHVFGTGESDIGERIADLMARDANPKVGTTAKGGIISIRIVATGQTPVTADAAADKTANEIRHRLGELIFGQDDQTLESVVGDALKADGMTLATAESCTGGMISRMMTETPGSSGYFLGGLVAYANSAKTAMLNVPAGIIESHGAVSEQVAEAGRTGIYRPGWSEWDKGPLPHL